MQRSWLRRWLWTTSKPLTAGWTLPCSYWRWSGHSTQFGMPPRWTNPQALSSLFTTPRFPHSLLHQGSSLSDMVWKYTLCLLSTGVPQGTVFSPLLYMLCIIIYVDDTVIYRHSFYSQATKFTLSHYMSILTDFYENRKIKLNSKRLKWQYSRNAGHNRIITPLLIKGTPVTTSKKVK